MIVDRGFVQAPAVGAGGGTCPRDQFALVIANRVSREPRARLFTKLRGERGLTFSAGSQLFAHAHGGDWRATADVTSARVDEGIEAFLTELRRVASERVPAQELDDAKRSMVASFALTLEQLAQVVSYISSRRVYGLSTDYWQRFPEKVMAISAEDVQRVARRYMDFNRLQVVAVGDALQLSAPQYTGARPWWAMVVDVPPGGLWLASCVLAGVRVPPRGRPSHSARRHEIDGNAISSRLIMSPEVT